MPGRSVPLALATAFLLLVTACGGSATSTSSSSSSTAGSVTTAGSTTSTTTATTTSTATGPATVWVAGPGGVVTAIAADTGEIVGTVTPEGVSADSLGVAIDAGSGAVWMTVCNSENLYRIDPETVEIVATIPVGSCPFAVDADGGIVAVAVGGSDQIVVVDPQSNEIVASADLEGFPLGVEVVPGAQGLRGETLFDLLFGVSSHGFLGGWSVQVQQMVFVLVLIFLFAIGGFSGYVQTPQGVYEDLVAAGGFLWVVQSAPTPEVLRLDSATGEILDRLALPDISYQLHAVTPAGVDGRVYAAVQLGDVVWQFDASGGTGAQAAPGGPVDVTNHGDDLFVVTEGGVVYRFSQSDFGNADPDASVFATVPGAEQVTVTA